MQQRGNYAFWFLLLNYYMNYEESVQVYSPNHTALTTRVYGITSINL